jgi:SAM-dependent methyltransferase
MNCPLCQEQNFSLLYEVRDIPVFQNKVYETVKAAQNAQTANVSLMLCRNCGFVFNSDFDMNIMNYDAQYQNEQAHSPYFQDYLNDIINLFVRKSLYKKAIIEIGCGKAYFLENLQKHGFNVTGFDPAYEGNNPYIIKEYFSEKYSHLNGDVIVMRHILEHIRNPLNFLHNIAKSVGYKGMIFIEVPNFEWILQKKAFWDVFYEHCNYFTFESLGNLFEKSEQGYLFNHQYMYLLSDLNDLRKQAKPSKTDSKFECISTFDDHLKQCRRFVQNHRQMIVWGGGAKGATFVNLIDPYQKYISYIIDINPKKQNKYVAKSAHKIVSPDILNHIEKGDVFIMNENYYKEIEKEVGTSNFKLYVLGEDL